MSSVSNLRLQVKALQRMPRRRAGFTFGAEPVVLTRDDFGPGLTGVMQLSQLLDDPVLHVTMLDGNEARAIGADERAALTALLEVEQLRVDPTAPPAAAAQALAPAADAPEITQMPDGSSAAALDGGAAAEAAPAASAVKPGKPANPLKPEKA